MEMHIVRVQLDLECQLVYVQDVNEWSMICVTGQLLLECSSALPYT